MENVKVFGVILPTSILYDISCGVCTFNFEYGSELEMIVVMVSSGEFYNDG